MLTIASSGSGSIKLIVLVAIPVIGLVLRFALRQPPWWMQRARGAVARQKALGDPVRRRAITVLTALIGVTLLAAAGVRLILAIVLSTSTFLSVSSVTEWAIIAAGGVPALLYAHYQRSRLHSRRPTDPMRDVEDDPLPPVPRTHHGQP